MLTHYVTPASKILDAIGAVDDNERGHGYRAFCPVHESDGSHSPSLVIDFTDEGKALVVCQSRRCDFHEILASVGLTPSELSNVAYVGQTLRGKRETAPASVEQRATLEARAFRASMALQKLIADGDPHAQALADRFGLPEGYNPHEAGIGWEPHENGGECVVYTRSADGHIAWLQRRDFDAPDSKWLSTANPGKGTDEEARWDAAGTVGPWRSSGPVIITEGASDSITVAALGQYDVIGIRGAGLAERIDEVRELLVGRSIVVVADEDAAGEAMTRAIIDHTDSYVASASWVRWGSAVKGYDVRDFRNEAPDAFKTRFAKRVEGAERQYRKGSGFDASPYAGRGHEGAASAIRDYVRALGYDLAFTRAAGWMFYDGTQWLANSESVVLHLAGRLAKEFATQVLTERGELIREALSTLPAGASAASQQKALAKVTSELQPKTELVKALQAANEVSAAFKFLRGHPSIAAELTDFDADPDVLAVANGVVELRTGKLRPMRPSDKITARLATGYREDAEAPKFMAFMREVFVNADGDTDEELVSYMLRLIGYAVTGHSSEQKLWILHSPRGSNGKSQFLGVLQSVFGSITESTSFSTFEKNSGNENAALSDLASLRRARIVVASEGSGKALHEDRLKAVTGEDLVKAKYMRQDLFAYRPQFAMLLATNVIPEFSDDSAVWRRLRIVPFLRHFSEAEQVKGIGRMIAEEEAEGILALAVREAAKWYVGGLPSCAAIDSRTEEERVESDVLQMFLAFNVEETGNPKEGNVLLVDLWARFQLWSEAMGEDFLRTPGLPESARQLKTALVKRWDLPTNRTSKGAKVDRFPVRWAGRRLVAPSVVNKRFNESRADALGAADYVAAGPRALELGEDAGVAKYGERIPGLTPRIVS